MTTTPAISPKTIQIDIDTFLLKLEIGIIYWILALGRLRQRTTNISHSLKGLPEGSTLFRIRQNILRSLTPNLLNIGLVILSTKSRFWTTTPLYKKGNMLGVSSCLKNKTNLRGYMIRLSATWFSIKIVFWPTTSKMSTLRTLQWTQWGTLWHALISHSFGNQFKFSQRVKPRSLSSDITATLTDSSKACGRSKSSDRFTISELN